MKIQRRRFAWLGRAITGLLITTALALLGGCAQQVIREDATTNLRTGNYEAAINGLQAGVNAYPDSALLKAGLVSARTEVTMRLIAEASQQRGSGRYDEAEKTLARALKLDPSNDRLIALDADLQVERRAQKLLDEAQGQIKAGNRQRALRLVERALRDMPRQPVLLALQRRLEGELRSEGAGTGRALAESRPITLDFRGAPLGTVLDAVTRGSGVDFILDRDVPIDKPVTIYLRSARVEDAIDLIASANQLGRRIIDSQTVQIYPNTQDKQREHQEQVVRVYNLSNADAKNTAAMLRNVLRLKDPYVDERANAIVLRESPDLIALADRLVALHDLPEGEVMLEVEILEVTSSRLTELGINYPNSIALTPLNAAGGTGITVADLRNLNESRIGVSMPNLIINLRREVGDVNILANPRIRTKNREKARIMIGDKVPVVTSTATATGFVSESVSYLDVGLKLEAEPTISPDDEVSIRLGLEVSSIANTARTAGGSTVYQIGTRNASTVLRLRDGETQLLAGLISSADRSNASRIPGLGDLPVAGRLFSSQKDDVQRTELVLSITPRIVRSAPRPDLAQAELWVGSEAQTRLRPAPWRTAVLAASAPPRSAGAPPAQAIVDSSASPESAETEPPTDVRPRLASPSKSEPGAPALAKVSWSVPVDATVGQPFTISLKLASDGPLRSLPIEIALPQDKLEVLEVLEGDFFKRAGASASFIQAFNPTTGKLSVSILSSDANGAAGEGSIVQMRLKPKSAGASELKLSSFKPIASEGSVKLEDPPVLRINVK